MRWGCPFLYCLLELPTPHYQTADCLLPTVSTYRLLPIAIWLAFSSDMSRTFPRTSFSTRLMSPCTPTRFSAILPTLLPLRRAVSTAKAQITPNYMKTNISSTRTHVHLQGCTSSYSHLPAARNTFILVRI